MFGKKIWQLKRERQQARIDQLERELEEKTARVRKLEEDLRWAESVQKSLEIMNDARRLHIEELNTKIGHLERLRRDQQIIIQSMRDELRDRKIDNLTKAQTVIIESEGAEQ